MPTSSIPRHPFLRHSVSHLLCPPFILLPFSSTISSPFCIALILTITPPLTPRWDDPVGPLFLTFFLIVALVVQFFVKVLTQTIQAINCFVLFWFDLIWFIFLIGHDIFWPAFHSWRDDDGSLVSLFELHVVHFSCHSPTRTPCLPASLASYVLLNPRPWSRPPLLLVSQLNSVLTMAHWD